MIFHLKFQVIILLHKISRQVDFFFPLRTIKLKKYNSKRKIKLIVESKYFKSLKKRSQNGVFPILISKRLKLYLLMQNVYMTVEESDIIQANHLVLLVSFAICTIKKHRMSFSLMINSVRPFHLSSKQKLSQAQQRSTKKNSKK